MRQDLNLLDLAGELELQNYFLWVLSEPGEGGKRRETCLSARKLTVLTSGTAIHASAGCDTVARALDSPGCERRA